MILTFSAKLLILNMNILTLSNNRTETNGKLTETDGKCMKSIDSNIDSCIFQMNNTKMNTSTTQISRIYGDYFVEHRHSFHYFDNE